MTSTAKHVALENLSDDGRHTLERSKSTAGILEALSWKEKEYYRNELIDNYLFPNKRQIISLEKIKKLIYNNI